MRIMSLFICATLALVSCSQREGCTEFGAENYDPDASVNDGSCIKVYDKFVGAYMVDSDCYVGFYRMEVNKTNDDYKVKFVGLADTLEAIEADIIASDFIIRQREIKHHIYLEAAGTAIDGGISMSYHIRDETSGVPVFKDCLLWCSKQ